MDQVEHRDYLLQKNSNQLTETGTMSENSSNMADVSVLNDENNNEKTEENSYIVTKIEDREMHPYLSSEAFIPHKSMSHGDGLVWFIVSKDDITSQMKNSFQINDGTENAKSLPDLELDPKVIERVAEEMISQIEV